MKVRIISFLEFPYFWNCFISFASYSLLGVHDSSHLVHAYIMVSKVQTYGHY